MVRISGLHPGARLAWSVQHGTLNPRVVGLSPMFYSFKIKIKKGQFFCHHLEPSKEGENQRIRPLGLNRKSDRKKLRDCFFIIPLAERNCKRFAFSVPALNSCQPLERFQWKALPAANILFFSLFSQYGLSFLKV